MIMKVVIATHNKDKLKELRKSLSELDVDLLDLSSFPEIGNIIEDGETIKENGFINTPKSSIGARRGFNHIGTPGIQKICFQYVLLELEFGKFNSVGTMMM